MSSGLEAIANELRRLQRDGVDRVFVEDHTMRLLVPKKGTPYGQEAATAKTAASADHGDLRALVQGSAKSEGRVSTKTNAAVPKAPPLPEAPEIELPEGDAATQIAWLHDQVHANEVCQAHLKKPGKIVFGTGSTEADIFFCGEAPGEEEALAGEPFVGKAGQLLTKIIHAMGLSRESTYLTYIMKWRPQHDKPYGNRPPTTEEMRFCLPYLQAQIEIIQPKVIIALGNAAVTGLLGHDPERNFGPVRGTWASFDGIPLMITFHPSYLLRNDTLKTKRMAWEDMLQVMKRCGLSISEKQRGFFLSKT